MQKYCLGCGVEIIEGAAYCGACGVATTGTDSIGEDSSPQRKQPISPLVRWGIAAALIGFSIYGFTYYKQNSSPMDGGEVSTASLSGQTEAVTEDAEADSLGLAEQLEMAIERNPGFDHCGILSYYLAENLSSNEIIDYNRSGLSVEVSARPGYENLVRNKKARFGDDRTEPWFCPGDIDVNISNFIPPSQGQNSVIVKYSWRTTNIPSKVQSLIDQGLLVVTRPENPNEEADFEPFHDAKEFVYSGESKMVLVQANNGWIPQESF